LSVISFGLSAGAVAGCNFVKGGGLFKFEHYGVCFTRSESVSAQLRAGQAFGVMAALFGGIVMLFNLAGLCIKFPHMMIRVCSGVLFTCFVFQLFTFLALIDCSRCKLGGDGVTSIFAALFYLITGIVMSICPESETVLSTLQGNTRGPDPTKPSSAPPADNAAVVVAQPTAGTRKETTTEHVDAAGNKTIIKETTEVDQYGAKTTINETTNPDGTKTVTKTTEK